MSDLREVLIASDASGALFNSCVWDINTGTTVQIYKGGGTAAPHTVCPVGNDYILAAERLKPLLHVWPVNGQETVKNIRLVVPGKVTTLDVSADGLFCAAGIEEKLYVWQIASGKLLAVCGKHFLPIVKVLFSGDGALVVTAGEDGLVLIWPLAQLISMQQNDFVVQSTAGQTDPIYTISDHSMPVKDLCVGKSGPHARFVTVSSDRTMKLYQLAAGQLLLSVVFEESLTAVTLNNSESKAYAGTVNGNILEVCFLNPPRNIEHHISKTDKNCFKGHTKTVTCLTISIDARILVSGAADDQICVWHVETKQKIRNIMHKGVITNATFWLAPKNLFSHEYKPTAIIKAFQRTTESDDFIDVINTKDLQLPGAANSYINKGELEEEQLMRKGKNNLTEEINKLKSINAKLYSFAMQKIIPQETKQINGNSNKRKRSK